MRTVATIEARMTSSRLPGKVLLPAGGKPMLAHLIQRLKTVNGIDQIVIATTSNTTDTPIVNLAEDMEVKAFRGSEEDVLARVLGAAQSVQADTIIQITGDCPIIDPAIVENVFETYRKNDAAYVSNAHIRSYPDGMDVQVYSTQSLQLSASLTKDPLDREHVSLHMRKNPELFKKINLLAPRALFWPELGLTLDEESDYILLKTIIEHFGEKNSLFGCGEVIDYLKGSPELLEINKAVVRKGDH